MPKDYPRSDRISQQIKKEIAEILSLEIKDPALKKISIIDVEVAHDLKNAKVFYVADHNDEEIVKGLKRSLPFFSCWQKECQPGEYQSFILNMIKQLTKVQKYQSYWIQLSSKKF